MFAHDSVGGGLGASAIHTRGMGPGQLSQAIIANAVRIFNAGGMGLRGSGVQIGERFKAEVQALYSTPGTGKPHKTKKAGGASIMHAPSVPGQPPAMLTGELRDSVRYAVYRKPGRGAGGKFVPSFGKTEIVIYTRVPYAYDLEMGTRGKGKQIAKRPAWRVVHNKWAVPGPGSRLVQAAVSHGYPDNFIAAERRAASQMMLGNPKGIFGRETAAGR
jgi:hypothetical protein